MLSLWKGLRTAVAGGALAVGFTAAANAGVVLPTPFNFTVNGAGFVSVAQGGPNNSLTNITQLGFDQTGASTILQKIVGGSPLGQPFTDTGVLVLTTFTPTGGGANSFISLGGQLTLHYSLTGFDDAGTKKLVFNPGGVVQLFLGANPVANFSVVPPSGSTTNLDINNGAVGTLSLGLTLVQVGPPANLITDLANNSLEGLSLDIVTAQPQFTGAGSVTTGVDCSATFGSGAVCDQLKTSALPGTIQVATTTVPEPASVALLGFGLLGMVGFARRRNAS